MQFVFYDTHRNTLTVACQRSGNTEMTAGQLAAALNQPVMLRPMGRKEFFMVVVQNGGDVTSIAQLYGYSAYMADVETALQRGDLLAASGLLLLCPVALTDATRQIITNVLNANALRLVDVVAEELGEPMPQTVDAENVTIALQAAGYTWSAMAWVR